MSLRAAGQDTTDISISGELYGLDMDGSQSVGTTRPVSMQKAGLHIGGVVGALRSVTHSSFLSQPPPGLPALWDLPLSKLSLL